MLIPETSLNLSPNNPFRVPESMKIILPPHRLSRPAPHHSASPLCPELFSCPLYSSPQNHRATQARLVICKSTCPSPLHLSTHTLDHGRKFASSHALRAALFVRRHQSSQGSRPPPTIGRRRRFIILLIIVFRITSRLRDWAESQCPGLGSIQDTGLHDLM